MYTQETREWVKDNEKVYDIIILNTCPFSLLSREFWYGMWKVLSKKGKIFMTAISDKNSNFNLTLGLTIGDNSIDFKIRTIDLDLLEFIRLLFDIDKKNKMLIRKNVNIDNVFSVLLECTDENNNLDKLFVILPYNLQKFTIDISSHIMVLCPSRS